jgi:hypothetical protein
MCGVCYTTTFCNFEYVACCNYKTRVVLRVESGVRLTASLLAQTRLPVCPES